MNETFLAIVNPAAGGGRGRKLVGPAFDRLRADGIEIDSMETTKPAQATELARDGYRKGYRRFIAVGGDGTSYEIVNGLFPEALQSERPALAFLPIGTGNSFLREFTGARLESGLETGLEAMLARRSRRCDVLRLTHRDGALHYINLLSVGFTADVATMRARRFNGWGELGYQSSIFVSLARFRRRPFPLQVDEDGQIDRRPCLFLTFNNSKYTGGTMMIAPNAEIDDGLVEYVRWGPIGRVGLIRNLPTLYDGTHVNHPLAERRPAKRIDFYLDKPVDVMVDGEVLTVHCQTLDVLPSALNVVV
ncbi:MAG: diacylglycerol kinase family lipid kinase [Acidobacteriota bacterium]|nr:diacylglycerol kinase family lipid kinase [Acidobacteriota bacterium]